MEPEIKDFHFYVKGNRTVFEKVSMKSKTEHQEAGNISGGHANVSSQV